jgi:hypothetical protein
MVSLSGGVDADAAGAVEPGVAAHGSPVRAGPRCPVTLSGQRPGRRVVISWRNQLLPSGSSKAAKDP